MQRTPNITHALLDRHVALGRPSPTVITRLRREYRIDLDGPNVDLLFETVAECYLGHEMDPGNPAEQGMRKSATRLIGEVNFALVGDNTV